MTKQINTLADYVYTKFMEEEIAKAERGSNGDNEVYLSGIKSVDKLYCNVIVGVDYRRYYLKIQSEDLLDFNHYQNDKIYYFCNIMSYDATKNHHDEMDKKEAGSGYKCKLKIIKKEDVEKCIDLLIKILKELKFDNFKGEFRKEVISKNIYDCLECSNIEIEKGEECCVCYEPTLTKTWCKHSVCFRCMENISTYYQEEHDGLSTKDCPICRKNIIFRDNDDED
jgi:hypothetical protein